MGTSAGRCRHACWSPAGHQHGARRAAGLPVHGTQGCQEIREWKRRRGSVAVPPARRILWTLLSAGPSALLMGKPDPAKFLCCGLSPALPLTCPMAPHQARREVTPRPRAQALPLWGRAKTQEGCTPSAELSPQKGNPTQTLAGGFWGNLLKQKDKAVGRPVKRGVVCLQMYRCSYYKNTILTVLQSHIYYQPG